MPADLTPVLRKVHDAWAKLKAAGRAEVRGDGAKSDADGRYVQKLKEIAKAALGGINLAQKQRFDDQINALKAKKVKADKDAIDAAEKVKKAEEALVQANFEYHQTSCNWCSKNSCCLARQSPDVRTGRLGQSDFDVTGPEIKRGTLLGEIGAAVAA